MSTWRKEDALTGGRSTRQKLAKRRHVAIKKVSKKPTPRSKFSGKKQQEAAKYDDPGEEVCVTSRDPETGKQIFYCRPCDEEFDTGQALGGHMSRVHPGKSESYARKIARRREREFDRELLRLSKEQHAINHPSAQNLDRVKIRRYKKLFKRMIEDNLLEKDAETGLFLVPLSSQQRLFPGLLL